MLKGSSPSSDNELGPVSGTRISPVSRFPWVDCSRRCAILEHMAKDIEDKPLTARDIHEVLIPAMEEAFATRKDVEACFAGQERRIRSVIINVLREHGLLPPDQLEEIDEIEVQ